MIKENNFYKKDFEERLKKFIFNDKHKKIIAINGKWGTGKSHFIKDFIKNHTCQSIYQYKGSFYSFIEGIVYISLDILMFFIHWFFGIKTKKIIYISLFDKKDCKEVLEEIVLKVYKEKNFILSLVSSISRILLPNISIDSIFKILDKNDFENLVICFDDIERISPKFEINNFLGLLSELKENKKCDIILILNKNQIKQNKNIKVFNKYSEKCIDSFLTFEPDIKTLFHIAKNETSLDRYFDENIILKEFEKVQLTNLRTMMYVLRALDEFGEFMKTQSIFDKEENKNTALKNIIKALVLHKELTIIDEIEQGKYKDDNGEFYKIDIVSECYKDKSDILKEYIKKINKPNITDPLDKNRTLTK